MSGPLWSGPRVPAGTRLTGRGASASPFSLPVFLLLHQVFTSLLTSQHVGLFNVGRSVRATGTSNSATEVGAQEDPRLQVWMGSPEPCTLCEWLVWATTFLTSFPRR